MKILRKKSTIFVHNGETINAFDVPIEVSSIKKTNVKKLMEIAKNMIKTQENVTTVFRDSV